MSKTAQIVSGLTFLTAFPFCAAAAASGLKPIVVEPRLAPEATLVVAGTLTIRAVVDASASLPNGATVRYNANASVIDASFTNNHSISGSAVVVARKITIQLSLPYVWKMLAAGTPMNVSLFLSGNASTVGGPAYNLTTSFSTTLPAPPNGAATPINLAGSL